MGEIVIRFDRFVMERMIYIIIILVLAVLLVFSYLSDSPSGNVVQENNEQDTEQNNQLAEEQNEEANPETEPAAKPESIVDATCSDGIENQDETAVDCGGVCTSINGEYFYDGECHTTPEPEVPELSGDITLDVDDVKKTNAPGDGDTAIKVTEFTVTVENGVDDRFFGTIVAYAKSTSGLYLNQESAEYDETVPYMGPYDLTKLEAGESLTMTFDDEGQYVREIPGYSIGDDFRLEVNLLDDNGDKIDEYVYTVRG